MCNLANEDKLLLIFIHGFKGHQEHTFLDFPNRLRDVLTNSLRMDVESIVYPTYDTRGDLTLATRNFCDWLNEIIAERDVYTTRIGGSSRTLVVLCGHSMGGILAADAILDYQTQPSPPNIIGLIAYDTPFYSIHPDVLTNTAWDRVGTHINNAYTTASTYFSPADSTASVEVNRANKTNGGGWGWTLAAVGAVAIAGVAMYSQRDKVLEGFGWATDHLQYVSVLASPNLMKRVDEIIKIPGLIFHCFYTKVTAKKSPHTFIALPPLSTSSYFSPAPSDAPDEIDAHMYMFDPKQNYYYDLGKESMEIISKAVKVSRLNA